jgi:hypothetical protein
MSRRSAAALTLALALLATEALAQGATVNVDLATQRRLGVAVAALPAARRAPSISGFAKVLDPGPLASLDSDIAQAAAAADASAAELKRSQQLHAADQTISTKALEAARAQAQADAAKLSLLRRRVGLEWGPGLAQLSAARRSSLLASIAAGKAALVRIDTPSGRGQQGLRSARVDLGQLGQVEAQVLGPARTADTQLLSPGLIAVATGPGVAYLSSGLTSPVELMVGGAASGVIVPRSALIRSQGQTWAYVRKGPTSFERRAVAGGEPDASGLFAPRGLAAGEQVVVAGAAALFTAEHKGEAEDKDGD